MEALRRYLAQFPAYKPALFDQLLPFLTTEHLEAGDYFLRQGQISKKLAFIEEGLMRLFYLNDGKEVTTCFCKENSISSSYRSLIRNTASELSIQAIEPCKLVVFSYDALQKLYEKDPFWQQVGRMAVEDELVNTECHNRFLNDLSATERYREVLEKDAELLQRVALNYLATYLQVAPETLSRIRKKIIRT